MGAVIKRKSLKPLYYKDFQCIGAACEDNCCNRPWRIFIDKNTYNKYRNSKDAAFREKVAKSVKRIRDKANEGQYAEFVLNKGGGKCPFQAEDGLCEIHRDLGEKYLSMVCKIYPRLVRAMPGEYDLELSVSMSCPHAVRLALFNEAPMEFENGIEELDTDSVVVRAGLTKPVEGAEPTHYIENGWLMREAAIAIMQDRGYSIAERVFIIGMMLNKISRLHDEGNAEDIPAAIVMYRSGMSGGFFSGALNDGVEKSEIMQYKAATTLYAAIERKQRSYSVFKETLRRFFAFLAFLKPEPGSDGKVDAATYFYAYCQCTAEEHWDGFIKNWAHVLENYLVNFIFSEIFPLKYHGKGLNPYHHALILGEQYALLKILLCCGYDKDEGFTKPYITKVISQVAEMNQHSDDPLKIAEHYKTAGLDGLPYLYYLLA